MGESGHEVVIVGGGPAGMMLAAELALAEVDVAVVELRTTTAQVDRLARRQGTSEFLLAVSEVSLLKASHVALNDARRIGGR